MQDYGESSGPGWLTEGIAEYARYKFGVNNTAAKWALPNYKLRKHTFTGNSWQQSTGKTLDAPWKSYTENPAL